MTLESQKVKKKIPVPSIRYIDIYTHSTFILPKRVGDRRVFVRAETNVCIFTDYMPRPVRGAMWRRALILGLCHISPGLPCPIKCHNVAVTSFSGLTSWRKRTFSWGVPSPCPFLWPYKTRKDLWKLSNLESAVSCKCFFFLKNRP